MNLKNMIALIFTIYILMVIFLISDMQNYNILGTNMNYHEYIIILTSLVFALVVALITTENSVRNHQIQKREILEKRLKICDKLLDLEQDMKKNNIQRDNLKNKFEEIYVERQILKIKDRKRIEKIKILFMEIEDDEKLKEEILNHFFEEEEREKIQENYDKTMEILDKLLKLS